MNWLDALRKRYTVAADPLRTQRRLELAALVMGLALCLQLAWGGVRLATLGAPGSLEPAADSMRVPAVRRPAEVVARERNEIIHRPLFWSSRRPVEVVDLPEDPAAGMVEASELRNIKQVGVFGSGGEAGIIVLVNGKKRRILLGETLNGWTLASIGAGESEFAEGKRRHILRLERGNVSAAAVRIGPTGKPQGKDTAAAGMPGTAQGREQSAKPGAAAASGEQAPQEDSGLGLGPGSRGRVAGE